MSTTTTEIRGTVGYLAVCSEGALGTVDRIVGDGDRQALVIRRGVMFFTRYWMILAEHVRSVDHQVEVVSVNGRRHQLLDDSMRFEPGLAADAGLVLPDAAPELGVPSRDALPS